MSGKESLRKKLIKKNDEIDRKKKTFWLNLLPNLGLKLDQAVIFYCDLIDLINLKITHTTIKKIKNKIERKIIWLKRERGRGMEREKSRRVFTISTNLTHTAHAYIYIYIIKKGFCLF